MCLTDFNPFIVIYCQPICTAILISTNTEKKKLACIAIKSDQKGIRKKDIREKQKPITQFFKNMTQNHFGPRPNNYPSAAAHQ